MRVLFSIHHNLDPNAGATGATLQLGQAMRSLGHDVDFLSFDDMQGRSATKRFRFPLFVAREIAKRSRYDVYDLSSGDGWAAEWARKCIHRKEKPSFFVARSHGLEHVMHDAFQAECKLTGAKPSWKYPIYNGGFRLWECRQSFAKADLALFLNEYDQQYAIRNLGIDRRKATCVKNGVSDTFIQHASMLATKPAPATRVRNVAFVGSYIERKGIKILRDAMATVLQQFQNCEFGLFGTGLPTEVILADYPQDVRSRIKIIQRYTNANLPSLLKNYHVLAFPSTSEGFPLAPVEAMACGLVPVVTDISGSTAIVEQDKNGLVVARSNVTALKDAIIRLLTDDETWVRLRSAAITNIASYSWTAIARLTAELYQRKVV